MKKYDKIIIGAGVYGLYAALYCLRKNQKVLVLEYDDDVFERASFINQARVHNGYHYPRSISTANSSSNYYDRFVEDFGFCINNEFDKIYATATNFSWCSNTQFEKFCKDAGIFCEQIDERKFFKKGLINGAFLTEEATFDFDILKKYFLTELNKFSDFEICFNSRIEKVEKVNKKYIVHNKNEKYETGFVLNSTYASINQILELMNFEKYKIKYELCEMILCEVSDNMKNKGLTIMDGPFFSLMPFGKSGLHSLSAVLYTPHKTSTEELPEFNCQKENVECNKYQLGNCNLCPNKPETNWEYMYKLAKKYLNPDIEIKYIKSIFAIKSILKSTEIDDARHTIVKQYSSEPYFYSVLSGKINTIYDIEKILK